jgi:diacylglycerol kinase family enzyme
LAGIGLDARIVTEVDPDLKRRFGKFAYWIAAFRLVGKRLAEFDVRAGDLTRRCGFALAARVRNYGGDLEIARGASLLGRDFELVLFEGAAGSTYLKYFVGVGTGTLRKMDGATVLSARSLELAPVTGASVPVQVDGEFAGHLPATIEIVEDALTLLAPREYLASERRRRA